MIRLTLNAQSDPEIHLFNKSTILLGADSANVDLPLYGPDIQPIHLKISEKNGFPILINCTNDPFVSVNGHPFGKKLLNSGDIIVVHQITILFENLKSQSDFAIETNQAPASEPNNDNKQEEVSVAPAVEESYFPSFSLPFEEDVEALMDEDLHQVVDVNIEDLPAALPFSVKNKKKESTSLKDDYLRDLEDDNGEKKFENDQEISHLYQAWKWILIFIFSLLTISGGIGTIVYFSASDKSEAQETKAVQGVADIAMALTHAQLNHLKPRNQNWSDLEFLKNNLQAVLADNPSYASLLDAQGQFHTCSYSLRIYTNSDLSHFLVIAQPAPTFLYWLVPQSIIVVDSHLMEVRTLKDVRNLNRTLANSDPLEGTNGKEITNLIKQGGLVSLATLASESGHQDFAPPKNLAWIRPGAENLIHNAPRYHRLGQNLMKKAINLTTAKGSSQEVASLKQDVNNLNWLNHFILYTDQGKKSALLARQGLSLFAPSDKLLFGYIQLNAQGKIHQVYLLKDEEEQSIAQKEKEIALQQTPSEVPLVNEQKKSAVDHNHPVYIQLQSLVVARETELKPLIQVLATLINEEIITPRAQFQMEFQNLSHSILMTNTKHKQILKASLDSLFNQYADLSIAQFLAFVKEVHLDQLIQQDGEELTMVNQNCYRNIEILLEQIENSKTLNELNNLIHIASSWLNFDCIKDPHDLINYQNLVRNELMEKLKSFLLSPKQHLTIQSEDREYLQNLVSHERLVKPEEKDFFLNEFEQLQLYQNQEKL